jgi:hypothetical protein
MIETQRLLAASAKIAEIERQAMSDLPGWPEYLAQLSDQGRESAMREVTDSPTFNLWRALRVTLSELH